MTRKAGIGGHRTILILHRIKKGRERSVFMDKSQSMRAVQSVNIQSTDIMEVKREELLDIDTIKIDKMQPIEKKLEESGK